MGWVLSRATDAAGRTPRMTAGSHGIRAQLVAWEEEARETPWERRMMHRRCPVPVNVMLPRQEDREKICFRLASVYTEEECRAIIDTAEDKGFDTRERLSGKMAGPRHAGQEWHKHPALRQFAEGPRGKDLGDGPMEYQPETWEVAGVSAGYAASFRDEEMAIDLYRRILPAVPPHFQGKSALGFSGDFKVCKFYEGDGFERRQNRASLDLTTGREGSITVQVCLRAAMQGSQLVFLPGIGGKRKDGTLYAPEAGEALLFQCDLAHEMPPLVQGCAYVLYTELLYSAGGL
jgi:hypothetical protein